MVRPVCVTINQLYTVDLCIKCGNFSWSLFLCNSYCREIRQIKPAVCMPDEAAAASIHSALFFRLVVDTFNAFPVSVSTCPENFRL